MKAFGFARSEAGLAGALAALYVVLHLPVLAPSLEDIDSINFALALRDFDVANHQPHPPGYPAYVALGKASDALIQAVAPSLTDVRREALALAIWSALGGGVAVFAAWMLFVRLEGGPKGWALWGAVLMAVTPLFWTTGLRPLSDMTGLALALTSQALLVRGFADRRALTLGAAVAGLALGVRAQTMWLTVPLLVTALVAQRRAGQRWYVARPAAAFTLAGLCWGVPLLAASGGLSGYLSALGSQAGEDFAWVDMLLFNPAPRRVAQALVETFVLGWGWWGLAVPMLLLGAGGAVAMARGERRSLAILAVAFAPYTLFHLLLQETFHLRYALPVVPPLAWLATRGVAWLVVRGREFPVAREAVTIAALPLVLVAAGLAIPGGIAYGREVHPAFRAIEAARAAIAAGDRPAAAYSHYALRRPLQAASLHEVPYVEPTRSYEWLALVDYWVAGGRAPVWFFADPRRTDLALIDPRSRRVDGRPAVTSFQWVVGARAELGGARPTGVDWYRFDTVPGWFAAEGWALTPETGGLAKATTMGVDREPIDAYVLRRPGPFHAMVGVRHLGDASEAATRFVMAIDTTPVHEWTVDPANGLNDLQFIDLPQGLPAGDGQLAHLSITARSVAEGRPTSEVAVRQFDIQPADNLIWAFGDGWHEAEYETATGRRWRWTSERSVIRVAPARGVRLTLSGESPLKYVTTVPRVRLVAGQETLGELRPSEDFRWSVEVSAAAVAASGGTIAIETDQVYLPGAAEGTADARRLGLRLFEIEVDQGIR